MCVRANAYSSTGLFFATVEFSISPTKRPVPSHDLSCYQFRQARRETMIRLQQSVRLWAQARVGETVFQHEALQVSVYVDCNSDVLDGHPYA